MWINGLFQQNTIEDESAYFQYGQYDEFEFYTFDTLVPQATAWNEFPTPENPYNRFKYSSFDIELN